MKWMEGRRSIMGLALILLLLGALFAGLLLFNGSTALAQGTDGGGVESENDDASEKPDAAEGPDRPITGTALERASATALDYIGEGRVTGTEVGDEEGYYEVEITQNNGRQVDVHLDQAFNILGREEE